MKAYFCKQEVNRAMTKSAIIILGAIWLICTLYLGFATMGSVPADYPYTGYARAGSWGASVLLLMCIVVFIKQHKDKKRNR